MGCGCGENAIYKAISASPESPITQNYFLKFGLCSSLWRKGNPGSQLPIKRMRRTGASHTKGEGLLHCSAQLERRKIIFRAPLRSSGWSPRRPHQRPHSSHFVLLNFKAHIYVPQVAREPPRVKQFGADGRGTRPGTSRNTVPLPASLSLPVSSIRCHEMNIPKMLSNTSCPRTFQDDPPG